MKTSRELYSTIMRELPHLADMYYELVNAEFMSDFEEVDGQTYVKLTPELLIEAEKNKIHYLTLVECSCDNLCWILDDDDITETEYVALLDARDNAYNGIEEFAVFCTELP